MNEKDKKVDLLEQIVSDIGVLKCWGGGIKKYFKIFNFESKNLKFWRSNKCIFLVNLRIISNPYLSKCCLKMIKTTKNAKYIDFFENAPNVPKTWHVYLHIFVHLRGKFQGNQITHSGLLAHLLIQLKKKFRNKNSEISIRFRKPDLEEVKKGFKAISIG